MRKPKERDAIAALEVYKREVLLDVRGNLIRKSASLGVAHGYRGSVGVSGVRYGPKTAIAA